MTVFVLLFTLYASGFQMYQHVQVHTSFDGGRKACHNYKELEDRILRHNKVSLPIRGHTCELFKVEAIK